MDNQTVAKILRQTADLLEIMEANSFRIKAYRQAAQSIESLATDIYQIYQKDKLKEISGVGVGIEKYIKELIKTGTCWEFEKFKKQIPLSVLELLKIEGLGPKKVKFLYHKFKITSLIKLENLLKSHFLLKENGWGEKSEQNILKSIFLYKKFNQRFLLGEIYPLAQEIIKELKKSKFVDQIEICGSLRRQKETVGDIDILITSSKPRQAIKLFTTLQNVKRILAQGATKVQVVLKQGIGADLRVVKPESFGAAIHYFTGSKNHNIKIRWLGMKRNLRINEYGVYRIEKNNRKIKIGGEFEKDIFKAVGLPWINPELRENQGEIEAAQKKQLPNLIQIKDIKGDCHLHTVWSDGKENILEMAKKAKELGYQYLAVTDHASFIKVANGLDIKRTIEYLKAVKKADKKINGIKILAGIEVDIKKNGDLYLPNQVLKKFDLVIGAIHSGFKTEKEVMTKRIIKAMQNRYLDVLAHPSGRLINKREPYQFDFNQILEQAKKTKTILEINSSYQRLDLNANQARLAKEKGVKMIISTDAHNTGSLEMMKFGIANARRGWLEKKDIINTKSLKDFLKQLKRNK